MVANVQSPLWRIQQKCIWWPQWEVLLPSMAQHWDSKLHTTIDDLYWGAVRNGWCPRVRCLINLKAHGASLKKRSQHQVHYYRLEKGPWTIIMPSMQDTSDDWQHILICIGKSRAMWRTDTVKAMEAKCQSLNTRPLLQRVLITGIEGWLNFGDQFSMLDRSINFSSEVHWLIRQQNEVGWHQISLGRFSI